MYFLYIVNVSQLNVSHLNNINNNMCMLNCMIKIINSIRTVINTILSSEDYISPELYKCTSYISNIIIFNINLSLIYLTNVDTYLRLSVSS